MSERMATGVDARDYSWLERALDQLKAARGVLAPTYPFAYIFFGERDIGGGVYVGDRGTRRGDTGGQLKAGSKLGSEGGAGARRICSAPRQANSHLYLCPLCTPPPSPVLCRQ